MGSHLRAHGTDATDDRTAAQRRLDLLAFELDAGNTGAPVDAAAGLTPAGESAGSEQPRGRHRADALPGPSRVAGAALDQLPAGLRRAGAERRVTGQHVTVVALLVAVLVCGGAWWVLTGRPEPRAVGPVVQAPVAPAAAPTPGADSAPYGASAESDGSLPADAGATPATEPAATGTVVVDVAGRVRRPGLVTLPAGSRVADALESAGGARPGVDLAALNLARPLVDGEQILVDVRALAAPVAPTDPGSVPTTGAPVPPGSTGPLVDLNTATLEQLDTLPGVGPVTGQAILDWRAANGAFSSVDELIEVDGIGDATLADLRDLVTV